MKTELQEQLAEPERKVGAMRVVKVKSEERCSRDCLWYVQTGFCRLYKQVLRQDTDNTYRCDECKGNPKAGEEWQRVEIEEIKDSHIHPLGGIW